jgi:ribosome-binding protein aMBF1 (putative translation factor)
MTPCTICNDPTAKPPAIMTVDGRTLVLCPACSEWGYLRHAENMTGQRAAERIQGARNAGRWAREHAATIARWKREAGSSANRT